MSEVCNYFTFLTKVSDQCNVCNGYASHYFTSLLIPGVVNRGDSFRRRRSRSNSLLPPSPNPEQPPKSLSPVPSPEVVTYRVAMLGAPGVGKTALVSQFMTSECINAYDRTRGECLLCYVLLNGRIQRSTD